MLRADGSIDLNAAEMELSKYAEFDLGLAERVLREMFRNMGLIP